MVVEGGEVGVFRIWGWKGHCCLGWADEVADDEVLEWWQGGCGGLGKLWELVLMDVMILLSVLSVP